MINFKTAQNLILKNLYKPKTKYVSFQNAASLVLAEDIFAKENLPNFSASTMDGICVKAKDILTASKSNLVILKIQGVIKTGDIYQKTLKDKYCYKISTGAPLSKGADSVIIKEKMKELNNTVIIHNPALKGENIKKAGAEIKKGDLALKKGTLITPQLIGFLSALGETKIKVFSSPEISILVTGNELISPYNKIRFGKIRDSNSYLLKSALESLKINPGLLGVTKDNKYQLKLKIKKGLKNSDIFLITGAVSVGEYDYIKEILSELNVKKIIWQTAIRPGKPFYFGKHKNTLVFGLPGNPASVITTFYEFITPAILKLMGRKDIFLKEKEATLENTICKEADRLYFLRGVLKESNGKYLVRILKSQNSYALKSFRQANCFVLAPLGKKIIPAGGKIKAHVLEN